MCYSILDPIKRILNLTRMKLEDSYRRNFLNSSFVYMLAQ